jgi:hypothetical protein
MAIAVRPRARRAGAALPQRLALLDTRSEGVGVRKRDVDGNHRGSLKGERRTEDVEKNRVCSGVDVSQSGLRH